jgi:pimeloyl-ACP methyl ester carboxylesterase
VKPQGDLKAQIDALDAQIAEASRLGTSGELRRLYAKGIALLSGRPWTDAADYSGSLVLRTPRVVVDSSKPYSVRLEQIYAPAIELQRSVTVRVALRKRIAAAPNQPPTTPELVKDLGSFDGVARDLRESPFFFDLDLGGVPDGAYLLGVEVMDEQTTLLGTAALAIAVRKGVDDLVVRLEADAARAPEALRSEILFPVDRMRTVNRGRLELFPDIWAALGPIAGNGAPDTLDKIRHIPQIIVHGDADPTVPVSGSRNMVAKLKELGTEHKYIEVPGGLHSDVVAPNLAAIVEFFNTHKRSVKATSQQ